MQNLTPSIGTEQQFNHSWELLRVLAGLFEIRKQSGRARLGDVSSTAASEERIFSVSSRTSSGSSRQHSTDQWHSTAGKKTTKTDFWGARSIFFLSGRVLVWAVLEKLVLAHTGAQKFSKGEPALAPLKSSRQAGVCEEVEHCSSWQQHHTPPRNLLTWRPLLVKNQFENHAAKLISAFLNEVISYSISKLRSWSLTEGLRKGLLSEWERLN